MVDTNAATVVLEALLCGAHCRTIDQADRLNVALRCASPSNASDGRSFARRTAGAKKLFYEVP